MKKLYLILFTCISVFEMNAQYYLLPVVSDGQNPVNLNRELEIQQGAGLIGWTTILQGPQASGNWSASFSIPFKFYFNGALVTRYKASTSGVLTFNTKTNLRVDSSNIALPTSRIPDSSIVVWGLRAAMGDFIVIKTFGTAPHRQHWISYNSFSEQNLNNGFAFISIVLEESTNKIFLVEQRSTCLLNNIPCNGVSDLTLGIQIDSTTAYMVPGSPNYQLSNSNNLSAEDNIYYEFIPGIIPTLDVEAQKQLINDYYLIKEFPIPVTAIFKNIGSDTIKKVTFNYQVDNGPIANTVKSGLNIPSFEEMIITHDIYWNPTDNSYTTHKISSWISHINDVATLKPEDDTITSKVIVNDTFYTKKLFHENFNSSTSTQGKSGNDVMHAVLEQYPNLYTELSYRTANPQMGDPYHTIEAAARARYYGNINSIPTVIIDGKTSLNPNGYDNNTLLQNLIPAFHQLTASGTIKGQDVNINVNIKADAPLDSTTRLYLAISEKTTANNVKSNGEIIFYHVMKKMLPDTLGILVGPAAPNFNKTYNVKWTIPGNYRLPLNAQAANIINIETEHSIEDFSDLEVVAWLQQSDRTVLQSAWTDLDFTVANNDLTNKKEIQISPNPSDNFFFIDLTAFENINELKVFVADQHGKLIYAENTKLSSLFINTTGWTPGMYHIKVVGKNQEANKKIIIN